MAEVQEEGVRARNSERIRRAAIYVLPFSEHEHRTAFPNFPIWFLIRSDSWGPRKLLRLGIRSSVINTVCGERGGVEWNNSTEQRRVCNPGLQALHSLCQRPLPLEENKKTYFKYLVSEHYVPADWKSNKPQQRRTLRLRVD